MPDDFPRLTREQVRAVDRICVEEYAIPSLLLMEHAAIALRDACRTLARGHLTHRTFAIICGGGNNGGDGYALARLLRNAGACVTIFATKSLDELDDDAKTNARICHEMRIDIRPADPAAVEAFECEVLVDALLGTGLTQPPRDDAAELIRAMNRSAAKRLAVDLPSGLDCNRGRPLGPPSACVRADLTVTFVAEKTGFPRAAPWLGEVVIGDIGAPSEAIEKARST